MIQNTDTRELMISDVPGLEGGRSRVPSHKFYSELDAAVVKVERSRVPSHKFYSELDAPVVKAERSRVPSQKFYSED